MLYHKGAEGKRLKKLKRSESPAIPGTFGAAGGIRTLGRLLTVTRFPVVLVMTSSILLHFCRCLGHRNSTMYYTSFLPGVKTFFKKRFPGGIPDNSLENIPAVGYNILETEGDKVETMRMNYEPQRAQKSKPPKKGTLQHRIEAV